MDRELSEIDNHFLRLSFELAAESVRCGDHPFGALLERDEEVFLSSMNFERRQIDPTRHAESALVAQAVKLIPPSERKFYTLYSSTEPCWTCSGVAIQDGFRNIVYGCSAAALSRVYHRSEDRPVCEKGEEVIPALRLLTSTFKIQGVIRGPLLEDEAVAQHRAYWPSYFAELLNSFPAKLD